MRLETERLILRHFREEDFEAVHSYAGNAENLTYMTFGPNTEEESRTFIKYAMSKASESPVRDHQLAITLKGSEALIGGCSIWLRDTEAEVGWMIHRDYWKMAYGSEVGRALLKFGFEDLKQKRIVATCDADNIASSKLMEKIGMRRVGMFFDARPPHKKSDRAFSDELYYIILKEEWDIQKEIAYYKALPCVFEDFIEVPPLSNGEIHLVCTEKDPGDALKKYVPSYKFAICKGSEKIGAISLRIGYTDNLYYGGQIGYNVDEAHRGNGYALQACKLVVPVAKAHGMVKLLITNNYTNHASRRVCEKLGAKLIRLARTPEWNELYQDGQRFGNIFEWSIGGS